MVKEGKLPCHPYRLPTAQDIPKCDEKPSNTSHQYLPTEGELSLSLYIYISFKFANITKDEGIYKTLFRIMKHLTSIEKKIDELQADEKLSWMELKLDDIIARMEGVSKNVDGKIDDHGLGISSVRRAMEQLYDVNKRLEEGIKNTDKKVEQHEIML